MSENKPQNDSASSRVTGDEPVGDELSDGKLDDERSLLTAYALGELDDRQRMEIEARLRESADQRQAVDDVVRLGKLLRGVAARSSSPSLPERSPDLRQAVLAQLVNPPQDSALLRLPPRFRRRRFWLPLSLAAALAVTCGTLFALIKMNRLERAVAQRGAHQPVPDETFLMMDLGDAETADPSRDAGLGRDVTFGEKFAEIDGPATDLSKTRGAPHPSQFSLILDEPQGGTESMPARQPSAPVSAGGRDLRGFSGETRGDAESASEYYTLAPPRDAPPARGRLAPAKPARGSRAGEKLDEAEQSARNGGPRGFIQGLFGDSMNPGVDGQNDGRQLGRQYAGGTSAGQHRGEGQVDAQNVSGGGQRSNYQAWYYRNAAGPQPALLWTEEARDESLLGYVPPNTESYLTLVENPFRKSTEYPLSTFSVDVDTASYTNVRRFLSSHAMPPRDAVRIEELINYFQYNYPQPDGDVPFSITTDVADCPWRGEHRLLRVGLKGREIPADQRPASNLVFLLDVSGSMDAPNKLPLVKEAMYLLVDKLTENDRVAIVVYAGNSGLVLPTTNGQNKGEIRAAISRLVAGGSTNGGQGLQMAYDTAQAHFIEGGTNRVILATDGDFNVGVVDQNDLVRLIEEKAKSGVFLSALGFGIGNLKDGTLEKLADKGNGNYAYIDTLGEARRVLVEQLSATLVTIAKDVKVQIEFNPAQAAEYRLIGYEDRLMPPHDFHDDRKDAGEIGAGHSVTALYEIVPSAAAVEAGVEPLKYQRSENFTAAAATGELATIKLRYKEPAGQQSRLIERIVADRRPPRAEASQDMNFAAAVAAFGMLLRDSPYRGDASYQKVLSLAEQGLANDPNGYRSEFVQLVRQAREISGKE